MPSIRPAKSSDLDAILELCTRCGYRHARRDLRDAVEFAIRNDRGILIVAKKVRTSIAAWLHVQRPASVLEARNAVVEDLLIGDEHIESSLCDELITAAVDWARDEGLDGIRIATTVFAQRPSGFFRKLGFRPVKSGALLERAVAGRRTRRGLFGRRESEHER